MGWGEDPDDMTSLLSNVPSYIYQRSYCDYASFYITAAHVDMSKYRFHLLQPASMNKSNGQGMIEFHIIADNH